MYGRRVTPEFSESPDATRRGGALTSAPGAQHGLRVRLRVRLRASSRRPRQQSHSPRQRPSGGMRRGAKLAGHETCSFLCSQERRFMDDEDW